MKATKNRNGSHPPRQQPCCVELPLAPPCQHASPQRPCCRACERAWYKAASKAADQQRKPAADREAG